MKVAIRSGVPCLDPMSFKRLTPGSNQWREPGQRPHPSRVLEMDKTAESSRWNRMVLQDLQYG
jgi:hypothetical protein